MLAIRTILWFLMLMLPFGTRVLVAGQSVHAQLHNDLFQNYNGKIRPVIHPNTTTEVKINPALYIIDETDEAQDTISFSYWLRMHWKDEFLIWDPSKYQGITQIRVPIAQIWQPDILIYETVDSKSLLSDDHNFATIRSNGSMYASIPLVISTSCNFDMRWFPYDTQNCTFQFGSFSYLGRDTDVSGVDIALQPLYPDADLRYFQLDSEWTVKSFDASSLPNSRGSMDVSYSLVIKRRPLYYVVSFIVPSFIITSLSIIGLYCPFNSLGHREERLSLGLTTLLTMAVLLLIVAAELPKTSDSVPLLTAFLMSQLLITCAASLGTIVIMYFNRYSIYGREVPTWLRVLFCMRKTDAEHYPVLPGTIENKHVQVVISTQPQENKRWEHQALFNQTLNLIKDKLMDMEKKDRLEYDWMMVCNYMDVIGLLLFLAGNVLILVVVLAQGG